MCLSIGASCIAMPKPPAKYSSQETCTEVIAEGEEIACNPQLCLGRLL